MILELENPAEIEPYAFIGPYRDCFAMPEVAMDKRHIFMLYDVLRSREWGMNDALEIGSFNGASATAFVEAINRDAIQSATFCDVSVSKSLMNVIGNSHYSDRVKITAQPSWQILDSKLNFDFIFVDGSHDMDSVSLEMKRILKRLPLCIMAHDTNATQSGYSACEGAAMLKHVLEAHGDYLCMEDCTDRPNERTNRGLFFASRSHRLFEKAAAIFEKWK